MACLNFAGRIVSHVNERVDLVRVPANSQALHFEPWYLRKASLIACGYGIILPYRGGADHQVALAYRDAALGQIGP
jgi:hypothetical protein